MPGPLARSPLAWRRGFAGVISKRVHGVRARIGGQIWHNDPTMTANVWQIVVGVAVSLVAVWLVLAIVLVVARPKGASVVDGLRILPDTLRLIRRLASDRSLPSGVRWRLTVLLAYLAMPFDLIPDFLPVIGQLDDIILVIVILRSVVRIAGGDAVGKHWPGTSAGLAVLWSFGGLPGAPPLALPSGTGGDDSPPAA